MVHGLELCGMVVLLLDGWCKFSFWILSSLYSYEIKFWLIFEGMVDFMDFRYPKEKIENGFLGEFGLYLWKIFKNLKSVY